MCELPSAVVIIAALEELDTLATFDGDVFLEDADSIICSAKFRIKTWKNQNRINHPGGSIVIFCDRPIQSVSVLGVCVAREEKRRDNKRMAE